MRLHMYIVCIYSSVQSVHHVVLSGVCVCVCVYLAAATAENSSNKNPKPSRAVSTGSVYMCIMYILRVSDAPLAVVAYVIVMHTTHRRHGNVMRNRDDDKALLHLYLLENTCAPPYPHAWPTFVCLFIGLFGLLYRCLVACMLVAHPIDDRKGPIAFDASYFARRVKKTSNMKIALVDYSACSLCIRPYQHRCKHRTCFEYIYIVHMLVIAFIYFSVAFQEQRRNMFVLDT